MVMRRSPIVEILTAILFIPLGFLLYLNNPSWPTYILVIFCGLIGLISGILTYRRYFNKNLYRSAGAVILVLMWIVIYIISRNEDIMLFIFGILITLLIFIELMYLQPQRWDEIQKELENQDVAME